LCKESNYYQPGGLIECPAQQCGRNFSSVWLCEVDMSNCTSYGILSSSLNLKLVDRIDFLKGVDIHHETHDIFSFDNNVQCLHLAPEGHFYFSALAINHASERLQVILCSKNFCVLELEDPLMKQC
jgi:hypothetical protein